MRISALTLERFDGDADIEAPELTADSGGSVAMQRARAEAFAEGYAAGKSAAASRTDEEDRLAAAIALSIESEVAETPRRAVAEAGEALVTLLTSLCPTLAAEGFAVEAGAAFARAARDGKPGVIEISAGRAHAEPIEKIVRALAPDAAILVRIDPALEGATARAAWSGGGLEIDMEAAVSACLEALRNAVRQLKGERS